MWNFYFILGRWVVAQDEIQHLEQLSLAFFLVDELLLLFEGLERLELILRLRHCYQTFCFL